ncbi:MAG TPA: hypothetical protein VNO43_13400 [Candidatus Eisenbacteria bacterium]|nr:hypothetical protein [Candidatus Eisenbacteria bacterium]
MEIQMLRLFASEAELNQWMTKSVPPMERIGDLRLRVSSDGISISGRYYSLIAVTFEMLWHVFVYERKLAARLERVTAAGLGVSWLRTYLLGKIALAAPAIEIEGETLIFDLDAWLERQGLGLRTNLSAVHCRPGGLIVESARPEV